MSFQDSSQSWRAKAHISDIKPPILVGVCALMLCSLFFALNGIWSIFTSEKFTIEAAESTTYSAGEQAVYQDAGNSGGERTKVTVHVGGTVVCPGVYELDQGSRVQQVIEAAGGFSEGASRDSINLARVLNDGEQIIIPSIEDEVAPATGTPAPHQSKRININTAGIDELTTLSGIGEATAQKIVADRERNGSFSSPEELTRVSGIGEKKLAQILDYICV